MPNVPFDPRARILRLVASPLLATTSIAALLLAAPAKAGQTITNQTVATVTNPAGNATTSIVITGASVTGAVANAGTISPGKVVNGTTAGLFVSNGTTVALFVNNSTIGGGIVNSGTITTMGSTMGAQSAAGILVIGGAISGGITNTGTIDTSATLPGHAAKPMLSALGLGLVTGGVFTGAIANSGTILSQGTAPLSFTGGGNFSARVVAVGETIVANGGLNSPTGGQISSTITNTAMIGATLAVTSTFSVSGRGRADPALNVTGLSVDAGGGTATAVGATAAGGSVSGGITNAGTITASLSHTATLTDTGGNALSLAQSNASAHGLVASALGRFATASIAVVGGGSINGDIINSGSITASAIGDTTVTAPTNGGVSSASTGAFGISVSASGGFDPVNVTQVVARGGNFTGNITNAGTITASVVASENGSGQNSAKAEGVDVFATFGQGRGLGGTLTGAILNSGTIIATASGSGNAVGVFAPGTPNLILAAAGVFAPGTTNFVLATGIAASAGGGFNDAAGGGALVTMGVTNTGLVSASAKAVAQILPFATGISITALGGIAQMTTVATSAARSSGGVFRGNIVNNGTIAASSTSTATAANAQAIVVTAGGGFATEAKSSAAGGTLIGNVVNNGMIAASVSGTAAGSIPGAAEGIVIGFINSVEKNGGVATPGTVIGSVFNTGTIQVNASGPGERAIGIAVGTATKGIVHTGVFTGAIVNSGTVSALGTNGAGGTGVAIVVPVPGGITNSGTITGSTAAIDLSQEVGGATVINQAGGALTGSVIGSGNANADVLNVTGGRIVLSPTQSISGLGTYTQTGGTLVLGVTGSTTPGSFASLSAGTINLGGTLELAPVVIGATHFAVTQTYKDIIAADPPLSGSFAKITTPITLFTVSLSPDATTPNALDATLALSPSGLAASAQDLTQSLRLGLDAPQVLTQAVQDRLVASGGVLGEGAWEGAASSNTNATPIGHPNLWVRGADQFGSASGSGTAPGYGVNRAAPLIGGVDWRFDHGIVAGVAATYVASSASFKDGSRTNVSSYQGAAYAGWAGGPWYALGSAVVSFNDFSTARLLTPFGLPGNATSSPSGQSYAGHAEAGYHWGLPTAGVNVNVTPYAALDYVHASIAAFNETGGFGALAVNGADGNSFQTTLGVRLTSRIAMGTYGTLIPELRLGWNHEFLDASQKITASLVGVAGSAFSATGIVFGRDAALVGGGLSMELSPDAKVFVDYDGRLGSRLQEHSVSGGLKVRF